MEEGAYFFSVPCTQKDEGTIRSLGAYSGDTTRRQSREEGNERGVADHVVC